MNVRELVLLARKVLATYPGATVLTLEQVMAVSLAAPTHPTAETQEESAGARRRRVDKRAFGPETLDAFRVALARAKGNVAQAAAELEISRQRAYRILKRLREGGLKARAGLDTFEPMP
jgi:transcriptional regulator of acetoin/glycerol metabolism